MSFSLSQGISAAGYGAGELYAKKSLMDSQAEHSAKADEAAAQRAMRLEEFKQSLGTRVAEEQRTAQVARIDEKSAEIAESSLAPKRGLIESGIVDRSNWTPEQQAAVDQSLAMDKKQALVDPKTRTAAAIATGDISPEKAAVIERDDRRLDAAEKTAALKERLEMLREEGRNDRFDKTEEGRAARAERSAELQQKRLDVMMELGTRRLEQAGRKSDEAATTKEVLSFLDGSRKEVQSDAQNLRQLYQAEIKDASRTKRQEIDATYAPKFAEVERKRELIEQDYNSVREKVGLPARAAATPKDAPASAPKADAKPAPKADAKPAAAPQKVTSKAAFDKLAPGTRFIAPDGSIRIKP